MKKMSIKCGSMDCVWNDHNNYCKCTQTIVLADCYVDTVYEGRQHFHKCKQYEQDATYSELGKAWMRLVERHVKHNSNE